MLCRATVAQSFATFWMNVQSAAITESSPGDGEGDSGEKPTTVRTLHFDVLHFHDSSRV